MLPASLALMLLVGVMAGRRRSLDRTANLLHAGLYWTGLPLTVVVLAAAPVGEGTGALVVCSAALLLVSGLGWLYARRAFASTAERAAFTLTVLWPNTGALGVPISLALLGPDAVPEAVLYGSLVSAPIAWVLGSSIAAHRGSGRRGSLRAWMMRHHALLPMVTGLAYALSPLPEPTLLSRVALGGLVASSFVAFLAAGLTLARLPLALDRDIAVAVSLRVGVSPGLLLAAAPVVPMPRVFVVQAAMATALSTFNVALVHGLPVTRIAGAFVWSTGLVLAASAAWVAVT